MARETIQKVVDFFAGVNFHSVMLPAQPQQPAVYLASLQSRLQTTATT